MTRARMLVAALLVPALASCGGGSGGARSSDVTGRSGRLFVQTATSGELRPNGDDTMTLRLTGADSTIWFTDRPSRQSGTETTDAFVKGWAAGAHSFAKEPPNAVVQAQQNGARHHLPVQLTSARFDAGAGALEYVVRTLPEQPGGDQVKDAVPVLTAGPLGAASVFIDDSTQPSCPVRWGIPNVNNGINAGITGITGGSIIYTYDGEVSTLNGNMFGFIPSTGPFGTDGPDAWRGNSQQMTFVGNGLVGGQLFFITWFQAAPGSKAVTGSFLGAATQPYGQGLGCTVNVGNASPWPFTVTFSS